MGVLLSSVLSRLAQAGAAARLENRDDKSPIAGVGFQVAGAEQAADDGVGVSGWLPRRWGVKGWGWLGFGGLHVRPGPGIGVGWQGREVYPNTWEGLGAVVLVLKLVFFQHGQREPGTQFIAIGFGRGVAPGKVFFVKLDESQVVGGKVSGRSAGSVRMTTAGLIPVTSPGPSRENDFSTGVPGAVALSEIEGLIEILARPVAVAAAVFVPGRRPRSGRRRGLSR